MTPTEKALEALRTSRAAFDDSAEKHGIAPAAATAFIRALNDAGEAPTQASASAAARKLGIAPAAALAFLREVAGIDDAPSSQPEEAPTASNVAVAKAMGRDPREVRDARLADEAEATPARTHFTPAEYCVAHATGRTPAEVRANLAAEVTP